MVAFGHDRHSRRSRIPTPAIADFTLRQWLDMVAPTNFAWSNPEVLRKIMETGGGNFVSGLHNWIEDWQTVLVGRKARRASQQFVVGKDVAVTPGKVVYRNELIELIQYTPATPPCGRSRY